MYGTHIPTVEPFEVVAALVAALVFVALCGLAAAITVALARRAVRTGAPMFGVRLAVGGDHERGDR
jgi:hypothetical protein